MKKKTFSQRSKPKFRSDSKSNIKTPHSGFYPSDKADGSSPGFRIQKKRGTHPNASAWAPKASKLYDLMIAGESKSVKWLLNRALRHQDLQTLSNLFPLLFA
jgi:hypothetical protein